MSFLKVEFNYHPIVGLVSFIIEEVGYSREGRKLSHKKVRALKARARGKNLQMEQLKIPRK